MRNKLLLFIVFTNIENKKLLYKKLKRILKYVRKKQNKHFIILIFTKCKNKTTFDKIFHANYLVKILQSCNLLVGV